MKLFNFGVAKEANDYIAEDVEEIWIKGDNNELFLLEDNDNEGN